MKKALLTLTVIAFSLSASRGDNVLSDSFTTYPNGPIVGAPGSPWAQNTGTAGTMLASNSSLEVSGAASRTEDIVAPLSRVLTNTTDTAAYASFNIRVLSLPTTNGAYIAHFTASANFGNHRGRIWLSHTNTSVVGKIRLGIGNTTGSSAATAPYPTELDTNVVYKVVTRIDLTTGFCTLWIDPLSESDPSVTDTTSLGVQGITHFGFRQATGEGVSRINDLRVGSTFNDVAGTNSPPTISSIGTVSIPANSSSGPISFTIADSETAANSLVLSRTSSNATLLPTNNIVFGGSGVNRTVAITPVAGQEGTSTVGITVTDGTGASATTTFTVRVGTPSISNIPNQATPTNTPLTGVAFTVTDAETPNSLNVTATSTNQTLIPDANISVVGTGPNRTLTITPAANQAGISLITVTVSDGTQTASDTFVVTVFPALGVLIDEPFSYPDGTRLTLSTPWLNHSGSNNQTVVNGGKVFLAETNTEDLNHEFTNGIVLFPNSGVILYSSFKVNFSGLPSSGGDYFAHFKDDGTLNFRGRVFSSSQGSPAGQFRLGVANGAGSVSTNSLHPTFLTTNVTYTVVTRFNIGTEETTLWINPASESSTSVTAADAAAPIIVFSFALRQANNIGVLTLDDLKVGTQFTDVATVTPSYSLRIFRSGADVIVAWPTAASAFALQSATSLTLSNWQDVGQPPVVVGSENFFTNTAPTAPGTFFRLKN
jgi:hypothetical protein